MVHGDDRSNSLWLMTATEDAEKVAQYFPRHCDVVVELEHHEVTLDDFKRADFSVYIAEQRCGDFIYVPTRSTHQESTISRFAYAF